MLMFSKKISKLRIIREFEQNEIDVHLTTPTGFDILHVKLYENISALIVYVLFIEYICKYSTIFGINFHSK